MNEMALQRLREELDRVEYLLSRDLWDNEKEHQQLRDRHSRLMDAVAEAEGEES